MGCPVAGFLEIGMAEEALVFVEAMLFAEHPALVLELGLACPATVFVACVLGTPQTSWFSLARVADEARLTDFRVAVSGSYLAAFDGLPFLFRSRIAASAAGRSGK
jgi:pimeloyl-ACP methyl ester carboxylesterase